MHRFLLLNLWATLASLSKAISLWDPTGPYHVGYTQHVFNHTTINDPTKPGNIILSTIYFPTRQIPNATVPYADPVNAKLAEQSYGFPNGSASTLTTQLQFQAPPLTGPGFGNGTSPYPTLIFLPGLGLPCLAYTAIQTELASYGYTVVGIDHPGEAPFILLPDGSGITGASDSSTEFARAVDSFRVSDVLTVMSDPFLPSLIRDTGAPINTTHFGIFGHSIGGSGAAGVMAANDTNIASLFRVGVNMDGTFFPYINASLTGSDTPVVDLKRPFLELASESHFNGSEEQSVGGDQTWAYFNARQSGWRRNLQLNGTLHLDFSDFPLWVERLGGRDGTPGQEVGPANGDRVTHVVGSILRKFFGYIEGKGSSASKSSSCNSQSSLDLYVNLDDSLTTYLNDLGFGRQRLNTRILDRNFRYDCRRDQETV